MAPNKVRSSSKRCPWRRAVGCLVIALTVLAAAPPGLRADSGADRQPLGELLDRLRASGTPIVYSSRLVRADMLVPSGIEPTRAGIERALAGHGLALEKGPGGVLMVVAPRRPEPVPDARPEPPSPPPRVAPEEPPAITVHETIDVVRDQGRPSFAPGIALRPIDLASQPVPGEPSTLASRAPGVVSDRVDVGGSERGKQASLAAPATTIADNAYFIDGVETTDLVSAGHSTLFFDLD